MYDLRTGLDLTAAEREGLRQVLESLTEGDWMEIVTGDMLTLTAEGIMIAGKYNEHGVEQEDEGPFTIEEAFATLIGR